MQGVYYRAECESTPAMLTRIAGMKFAGGGGFRPGRIGDAFSLDFLFP